MNFCIDLAVLQADSFWFDSICAEVKLSITEPILVAPTCPPSSVSTYERAIIFQSTGWWSVRKYRQILLSQNWLLPEFLFWCICHNVDNAQSFHHQINQSTADRFHISHARVIRHLEQLEPAHAIETSSKHHHGNRVDSVSILLHLLFNEF